MIKVTTDQINNLHGKRYLREISVEPISPFHFVIQLPDYVAIVISKTSVEAKSVELVRSKWWAAIKEYNETGKKERKVIVYKYEGEGSRDDKESVSVGIEFFVGTEIRTAQGRKFVDEAGQEKHVWIDGPRHMRDRGQRVIDWTQEREEFFKGLHASLTKTHQRSKKFFSMSAKKFLAVVDSKGSNLLEFRP